MNNNRALDNLKEAFEQAIEMAKLGGGYSQAHGLAAIAEAQARCGLFTNAVDTLKMIENRSLKQEIAQIILINLLKDISL